MFVVSVGELRNLQLFRLAVGALAAPQTPRQVFSTREGDTRLTIKGRLWPVGNL
jgi:hypothetical protein